MTRATPPAARIRIRQLVEAQQHAAEPRHLCAQCNAVNTQLAAVVSGLEAVVTNGKTAALSQPSSVDTGERG